MNRRLGWSFAALLAIGCGDGGGGGDAAADGPPITFRDSGLTGARVQADWRMHCNTGDCMPATDPPARSIAAINGELGAAVDCDLQIEGTERRFNLSAMSPDGYGFSIQGARLPIDGGRVIDMFCQMRVFEPDDVDTIGTCGANPPSPSRPCQIQRVRIQEIDGVNTVTGEVRCVEMQEFADSHDLRDITSPTSASELATFSFSGCVGL
ncbi:MAG: hypothetical protein AB7S26_06900 [Sandaracinaceae bacterium]